MRKRSGQMEQEEQGCQRNELGVFRRMQRSLVLLQSEKKKGKCKDMKYNCEAGQITSCEPQ